MSDEEGNYGFVKGQLKALVERVERLEEEKKEVAEQIKEVYSEAKAHGFDTKILRKVIAARKRSAEERQIEQDLIDTYMAALDMRVGKEVLA